jgi:short-subunit dehydrogenase
VTEDIMPDNSRPLAVVTGASTGIGFELAVLCAKNGYDLVIAADEPRIHQAARELNRYGGTVVAVDADLSRTADRA